MGTRIMGASLINTIAIVREMLGQNRFSAIIAACPAATQRLLRRTLIAIEWVPIEQWSPFLQILLEKACHNDEQPFHRLLRAICRRDFTTVHRGYLTGTSPTDILSKLSRIWSVYYDTGSLTADELVTEGDLAQVTLHLRGVQTTERICVLMMQAYLEQIMTMAGAKDCSVQRLNEQHQDGKLSCDYLMKYAT